LTIIDNTKFEDFTGYYQCKLALKMAEGRKDLFQKLTEGTGKLYSMVDNGKQKLYVEMDKKNLELQNKISSTHKKVTAKVGHYAGYGKLGGLGTMAAGVGMVIGGAFIPAAVGTSLGLAGSPTETLQKTLASSEQKLANLHLKRLQILQQINILLKNTGFTPPDAEWAYHL
jgi:hypothetical protein